MNSELKQPLKKRRGADITLRGRISILGKRELQYFTADPNARGASKRAAKRPLRDPVMTVMGSRIRR